MHNSIETEWEDNFELCVGWETDRLGVKRPSDLSLYKAKLFGNPFKQETLFAFQASDLYFKSIRFPLQKSVTTECFSYWGRISSSQFVHVRDSNPESARVNLKLIFRPSATKSGWPNGVMSACKSTPGGPTSWTGGRQPRGGGQPGGGVSPEWGSGITLRHYVVTWWWSCDYATAGGARPLHVHWVNICLSVSGSQVTRFAVQNLLVFQWRSFKSFSLCRWVKSWASIIHAPSRKTAILRQGSVSGLQCVFPSGETNAFSQVQARGQGSFCSTAFVDWKCHSFQNNSGPMVRLPGLVLFPYRYLRLNPNVDNDNLNSWILNGNKTPISHVLIFLINSKLAEFKWSQVQWTYKVRQHIFISIKRVILLSKF